MLYLSDIYSLDLTPNPIDYLRVAKKQRERRKVVAKALGGWLQYLRKCTPYTQEAAAEPIGITPDAVKRVEGGENVGIEFLLPYIGWLDEELSTGDQCQELRAQLLVPRPRVNLILYYGVLGARASWRSEVVPRPASDLDPAAGDPADDDGLATAPDPAQRRVRGQRWADLMRRTFAFDVLSCPRCGGRLRLIALIEEAAVISRMLCHLALPTDLPVARPARAPPLFAVTGDARVDLDESAP